MSTAVRTRLAAAVLTAAVAGLGLLVPTAAHAATPGSPLKVSVTGAGALQPGGADRTLQLTVRNTAAGTEKFSANVTASGKGALTVDRKDITFLTAAQSGTPASDSSLDNQDDGMIGGIFPKGGQFGDEFSIPAGAVYTWQITLGAGKGWPVNDSDLLFDVSIGDTAHVDSAGAQLDLPVGAPGTGGPVSETLAGGTTLAPGLPLPATLTVTNKTGATIAEPWLTSISYGSEGKGENADGITLAVDAWTGSGWTALKENTLPAIPGGFADGATHTYKLRIRVTGYTAKTASAKISLFVDSGIGYPSVGVVRELTVLRTAPATGTPSSAPAGASSSATATPSAGSSTGLPSAGATAPTSAPASQAPTAGSLAHTGGGSDTGILVGSALALLGAGAALTVAFRLRRQQ